MLFTDGAYLVFLGGVLAVHAVLPGPRARKLLLLLASYLFYAAWDARFLGLIAASTLVDWAVGLGLGRARRPGRRRLLVAASLAVNLGLLGLFKYHDFFVRSAADLAHAVGLPLAPSTLDLVLPVGISFYTFQTLSYTLDVAAGRLAPRRDLLDFALFVGFFPQLVAGPIVRARTFLPQLDRPRTRDDVAVRRCLVLFLAGFVKKAVLADNAAVVVDDVFADTAAHSPGDRLLASALYAVQIFCDFSGYTDMAVASAGLLGYRLAANFRSPYLATSVTAFWRRWHISLSTWFRDYLYLPLGGSRRGRLRTVANLLAVFLLCGLWHGASWHFVAWGLLHGAALLVERGVRGRPRPRAALGWLWTLAVVLAGWVLFRAPDVGSAWSFLTVSAPAAGGGVAAPAWWWTGIVLALAAHRWCAGRRRMARWSRRLEGLPLPVFALGYGLAVGLVLPWVAVEHQPFVYFQF